MSFRLTRRRFRDFDRECTCIIQSTYFIENLHIYIGISDEVDEGVWRWVNGQTADFDMFDIVGLNKIDVLYEGNDRKTADWGLWNIKTNKLQDVNSDREYAFICETEN